MKNTDMLKYSDIDQYMAKTSQYRAPGKKIIIVLSVLLIAALASGGFFYVKYRSVASDPDKAVASKNAVETSDVLAALSKIIIIDSDKAPTVARVETTEALIKSNPDFYKNVVVGDYLLLYPDRAIIFRLKENKIVNVAPIVDTSKLAPVESATQPANTGN
jgi:hypothetical protein